MSHYTPWMNLRWFISCQVSSIDLFIINDELSENTFPLQFKIERRTSGYNMSK